MLVLIYRSATNIIYQNVEQKQRFIIRKVPIIREVTIVTSFYKEVFLLSPNGRFFNHHKEGSNLTKLKGVLIARRSYQRHSTSKVLTLSISLIKEGS